MNPPCRGRLGFRRSGWAFSRRVPSRTRDRAAVLSPCGGRDDTPMVRFFPWLSITGVRRAIFALTVASGLVGAEARADDRARLSPGRFSIDLFQGPLLAPISVTGIAGAYAAYAEGISGFVANAA